MYLFLDKTCPFCAAKFKAEDDIVICSDCDMPHHKDCWISNCGCTTFGCNGTIKAPEEGPNSVTATEISFFDDEELSLDAEDVAFLIGEKNREYYAKSFKRFQKANCVVSWNWSAFFIPFVWLFYRRMYILGLSVALLTIIASFMPLPLFLIICLLSGVTVSLFGDRLYYNKVIILKNKVSDLGNAEKVSFLYKYSGVNNVLAALSFLAYLICAIFLFLI